MSDLDKSDGVTRHFHMCQSVDGPLANWKDRDWEWATRFIFKAGGEKFSNGNELKMAFLRELSLGHEVIPIGPICEGFDYKTGCPGHEIPATEKSK